MDSKLQQIYQDWQQRALAAGFTFDEFWYTVLKFIKDEFNSDSASWAIAGQLAYEDLIYRRSI